MSKSPFTFCSYGLSYTPREFNQELDVSIGTFNKTCDKLTQWFSTVFSTERVDNMEKISISDFFSVPAFRDIIENRKVDNVTVIFGTYAKSLESPTFAFQVRFTGRTDQFIIVSHNTAFIIENDATLRRVLIMLFASYRLQPQHHETAVDRCAECPSNAKDFIKGWKSRSIDSTDSDLSKMIEEVYNLSPVEIDKLLYGHRTPPKPHLAPPS